jgi:hypothetical protein
LSSNKLCLSGFPGLDFNKPDKLWVASPACAHFRQVKAKRLALLQRLLKLKRPGLKVLLHFQVKDIIMDAGDLETLSDRLGLESGGPIHRRQDAALALSA